jgi:hypothetical protein
VPDHGRRLRRFESYRGFERDARFADIAQPT